MDMVFIPPLTDAVRVKVCWKKGAGMKGQRKHCEQNGLELFTVGILICEPGSVPDCWYQIKWASGCGPGPVSGGLWVNAAGSVCWDISFQ